VIDGLVDDITERRRDREALLRSETELRALFAALPKR
jgi:PAS domain-containing protein